MSKALDDERFTPLATRAMHGHNENEWQMGCARRTHPQIFSRPPLSGKHLVAGQALGTKASQVHLADCASPAGFLSRALNTCFLTGIFFERSGLVGILLFCVLRSAVEGV